MTYFCSNFPKSSTNSSDTIFPIYLVPVLVVTILFSQAGSRASLPCISNTEAVAIWFRNGLLKYYLIRNPAEETNTIPIPGTLWWIVYKIAIIINNSNSNNNTAVSHREGNNTCTNSKTTVIHPFDPTKYKPSKILNKSLTNLEALASKAILSFTERSFTKRGPIWRPLLQKYKPRICLSKSFWFCKNTKWKTPTM